MEATSGSGQCRVCGGLALYQPVVDGPWWTHDDASTDHRVVTDTTTFGPDGVRLPLMPGTESTSAELRRVREERDEARAALSNALRCFDDLQSAAGLKYLELGAELACVRMELDAQRRLLAEAHATIRALLGARTEPTEGAPPA